MWVLVSYTLVLVAAAVLMGSTAIPSKSLSQEVKRMDRVMVVISLIGLAAIGCFGVGMWIDYMETFHGW